MLLSLTGLTALRFLIPWGTVSLDRLASEIPCPPTASEPGADLVTLADTMSRSSDAGLLRPRPSRVWRWVLVAAATLGLVALALRLLLPPVVPSFVLEERPVVRILALVGRVRPLARVRLGTTLSGFVREVRVREGDRVEAGKELLVLDDREVRAGVAEAEAALAEVTASVRATVEQAAMEAEQAQRDFDRIQAVFREGGLTEQRVEQARQRAADARSRLEAAQAQVDPRGAGASIASVARARASLESARARLALTRVLAPGDGVVLTRSVEPGDAVQPGRVLLEVALDGPTELAVFPAEENLGAIRVGAPAMASPDAFPGETFAAAVSFISPIVDPTQGTVEVRLSVPEPPDYLKPDMTVSVNIEVDRKDDAMVLPMDAVRALGTDTPWVAVVREGRLARQPVEVGLRTDEFVEILSGLRTGEPVVPDSESLEPNKRVRIRSSPET